MDPPLDGTPSAFALAVRNGDFELGNMLLEAGADVNWSYMAPDFPRGTTVLGELVARQNEAALAGVKYLLSKPGVSGKVTGDGRCVLSVAAKARVSQGWVAEMIMTELLKSPEVSGKERGEAVEVAARESAVEVLRLLLEVGEKATQELLAVAEGVVEEFTGKGPAGEDGRDWRMRGSRAQIVVRILRSNIV